MRRYLALLAVVMVAAAALAAVARRPASRATAEEAATPLPTVALELVIEGTTLAPQGAAVPKDHRVALAVTHRGERPATLALAGYEDRMAPHTLEPGETWRAEFVADRPGDDFAWLLDGRPAGRLRVTGSHLVEGHR